GPQQARRHRMFHRALRRRRSRSRGRRAAEGRWTGQRPDRGHHDRGRQCRRRGRYRRHRLRPGRRDQRRRIGESDGPDLAVDDRVPDRRRQGQVHPEL
ncbi:MAG: hypothetical protein AVDCRST_MAG69-2703, partial [uncultured Solirubrobacteraceae bacterium]